MEKADYEYLSVLIRQRSAITLGEGKEYLVEARLDPILRREQMQEMGELVQRLQSGCEPALVEEIVDAMTTNETSFFRDIHPFEVFKNEALPALLEAREKDRKLNIWCAASSSGQEPYSIAMTLSEMLPNLSSWSVNFWASDISERMLERCRAAVYSQLEVNRGLPIQMLVKYFKQDGNTWKLKKELREMVRFERLNLARGWPPMPRHDFIFIRNVLIYFDIDTKKDILSRMRGVLQPDGYLFLGGAESTMTLDDSFERVPFKHGSCYRLRSL